MENLSVSILNATVHTTSHRGFTPEELADHALSKILYISSERDDAIAAQAMAFREQIRKVLVNSMHQAIKSYKTTLCAELSKQGHDDMAHIVQQI